MKRRRRSVVQKRPPPKDVRVGISNWLDTLENPSSSCARVTQMGEFWQDMLLPWLPFYMRLRCRRLSRRHYAMDPNPPGPPAWVRDMHNDFTRSWFIALGVKIGFPLTPPTYDLGHFRGTGQEPAYCWASNPRSIRGTRIAISLERGARFTATRRTEHTRETWEDSLARVVRVPFPIETFPMSPCVLTTTDDFLTQLKTASTKYV